MAARIPTRLTVTAVIISALWMLGSPEGDAQSVPISEVKVTVFDETGAAIPNCELVFRGGSETIVSHTGPDGSLNVRLPNGKYVVQTSRAGFVKNNVQFFAPMPDPLRIVLQVDHTPITDGASFDGVPTTTSELPSVTSRQPIKKARSWHCLYLWKCSKY